MNADQFRRLLKIMGWTQRGFARMSGWSEGSVRGWARGSYPVPPHIAEWLMLVSQPMRLNPIPKGGFRGDIEE